MEIINSATGEVWPHVRWRDLFAIRRARRAGMSDREATFWVLGSPNAPQSDW
jgi:hypothetical protein